MKGPLFTSRDVEEMMGYKEGPSWLLWLVLGLLFASMALQESRVRRQDGQPYPRCEIESCAPCGTTQCGPSSGGGGAGGW